MDVLAQGNSAVDGGFASLAAQPPAWGSIVNCTVTDNVAASSGGGFLYSGTAYLSVENSRVSRNSAIFGGASALRRLGATYWNASFTDIYAEGNTAYAGGVIAVVDSAVNSAFFPVCSSCTLNNNTAESYGEVAASIPGVYTLNATAAVRPGRSINVTASMADGTGVAVPEYTNLLGRVECYGVYSPTPDPGNPMSADGSALRLQTCPLGTLQGDGSDFFSQGAVRIFNLQVLGPPGNIIRLRLSLSSLSGYPLDGAPYAEVNVTLLGCGHLEQYDPLLRACACVKSASRSSPGGPCSCYIGTEQVVGGSPACVVVIPQPASASESIVAPVVGAVVGTAGFALVVLVAFLWYRKEMPTVPYQRFHIVPGDLKVVRPNPEQGDPHEVLSLWADGPDDTSVNAGAAAGGAGAGAVALRGSDAGSSNNGAAGGSSGVGAGGRTSRRPSLAPVMSLGDLLAEDASSIDDRNSAQDVSEMPVEYRGTRVTVVAAVGMEPQPRQGSSAANAFGGGNRGSVGRGTFGRLSFQSRPSLLDQLAAAAGGGPSNSPSRRKSQAQRADRRVSAARRASVALETPGGVRGRGSSAANRWSNNRGKKPDWGRSNLVELCQLRHPNVVRVVLPHPHPPAPPHPSTHLPAYPDPHTLRTDSFPMPITLPITRPTTSQSSGDHLRLLHLHVRPRPRRRVLRVRIPGRSPRRQVPRARVPGAVHHGGGGGLRGALPPREPPGEGGGAHLPRHLRRLAVCGEDPPAVPEREGVRRGLRADGVGRAGGDAGPPAHAGQRRCAPCPPW